MDTMIREKDAALAKAIAFEAEAKAHFQINIPNRKLRVENKVLKYSFENT